MNLLHASLSSDPRPPESRLEESHRYPAGLGSMIAEHVAQIRSMATEFRDTETPQNPGLVSESQNLRPLRHMALGHAIAASQIPTALCNTTLGTEPFCSDECRPASYTD